VYKVYSDYTKQIVDTRAYDTFGNLISQTGSSDGNLGFQSKYFDQESGMYYFYHRYYNPVNGRFLNEDPIGLNGGLNMYAFVYNNPVNLSDPFGLDVVVGILETGWGAAVIEPGPVGETIMTVVTVVAGSYILVKWIFFSKTKSKEHNWASREAINRGKSQGRDPCDIISEWIKEAKCRGRKDLLKDFITAQKVLGCRNVQKRRSK
jgi:RHS repeat-associated protein